MPDLKVDGQKEALAAVQAHFNQVLADQATLRDRQQAGAFESVQGLRELQTVLDNWIDLQGRVSSWRIATMSALVAARARYHHNRSKTIASANPSSMEFTSGFSASYEERAAKYDMRVIDEKLTLEAAETLHKAVTELLFLIKDVHSHWDSRRLDTRWVADRIDGPSAPRRD